MQKLLPFNFLQKSKHLNMPAVVADPPFCDRGGVEVACCSGITITVAVALEAEKLLEEEDELQAAGAAAAEACGRGAAAEAACGGVAEELASGEFSFVFDDALEAAAMINRPLTLYKECRCILVSLY